MRIVGIRSVGDQTTVYGVIAVRINRRQFEAIGETDYEPAMSRRTARGYYYAAIPRTCKRRNVTFDFISVTHIQRRELDPKGLRHRSNSAELPNASRSSGVSKHQRSCQVRSNLLEQLSPFSTHAVFEIQEAGDIAAWVGHALYEAGTNRIWDIHEYNRDGASGLLQRRNCHTAYTYNYVRRERNQFRRVAAKVVVVAPKVPSFNLEIAANRPAQLLKCSGKDLASCFRLRIVRPKDFEYANDACALGRLCIRCNRPDRSAAKQRYEGASPHGCPSSGLGPDITTPLRRNARSALQQKNAR